MLQRTAEWFQARVGKVTASRIHDVMAKPTLKGTEAITRRNYRREIALERFSGVPQESGYMSFAMQQGIAKEAAARDAYAFKKRVDVEEVDFVIHPQIAESGASPDGFIGAHGILELKCPEANAMYDALVREPLEQKYIYQAQWQLACTNRTWADIAFYREGLPLEIVPINRDDALIGQLEYEVRKFLDEVDADYHRLCRIQGRI
jgi:putative phage-type endonuclease